MNQRDINRTGDKVKHAPCPKCGNETVVYNGNYFCSMPNCWIMSDSNSMTNRRIIATYLVQCMNADKKNRERYEEYLLDYDGVVIYS